MPLISKNAKVTNTSSNPVPVVFDTKGDVTSQYNEVASTTLETITVINFTVGVGKGVDLMCVECSGSNKAIFTVEINSSVIKKVRTWFCDFNAVMDFKLQSLSAGDNVRVIVENKTDMAADFNSTLIYSEYDL